MKYLNSTEITLLAYEIHHGEKGLNGKPFIEHPEAVASIAEALYMTEHITRANLTADKLQKILAEIDLLRQVATLHDSFEHQPKRASRIIFEKKRVHPRVISCVEHLTADPNLSYEENIIRTTADIFSVFVKRADLAHNSKTQRLPDRMKAGMSLDTLLFQTQKYVISYLFLQGSIDKERFHRAMKPYK